MACLLLVGLSALCIALCASCSRVQEDIPFGEKEVPDMELRNADYTLGGNASKSGSDEPFMIHASLITIYGKGRDTILEGVTFSQGRRMDGSCLKASVSSDNKKATLSGDVLIRIDNDGTKVTIRTQGIEWNGDDNTFLCTQEVDVTYGDGTVIRAEGFSASMDDNRYEFGRILEGRLDE